MLCEHILFFFHLAGKYDKVEELTANEGLEISVVLVVQVLVEGGQQVVLLLLGILYHLATSVLGKVLHEASLQGDPESSRKIEDQGLAHQT